MAVIIFNRVRYLAALLVCLALLVPSVAGAAEPKDHDGWNYRFDVYLWGANLTANLPGQDNSPVPFYKLLNDLKMGFMGNFDARKDKWVFNVDTIYLDVGDKASDSITLPELGPVTLRAKGDLKGLVMTPTVGYSVVDTEKARVDIVGGVRYLDLSLKARLTANDLDLLNGKESRSDWDALVGARAEFFLNDKWYMPMYGDIGTGDSDLTWQLGLGIGYRFNKVNVTLAYRYLKYEFDNSSDAILDNMTMKGPALGVSFYF